MADMSVSLPGLSAQPVRDDKSDIQEKTWQRVELSARLCKFSARICEFTGWAFADVRRTCLGRTERLRLQQARLAMLIHKLSAQRDKWKREEAEMLAKLSGPTIHRFSITVPNGRDLTATAQVVSPGALFADDNVNESLGRAATGLRL